MAYHLPPVDWREVGVGAASVWLPPSYVDWREVGVGAASVWLPSSYVDWRDGVAVGNFLQ